MDRIKKLKPLKRNLLLWQSDLSVMQKLALYVHIFNSYLMYGVARRKSITYLGESFAYDNVATPLCLMTYPNEVSRQVKQNIPGHVQTVLDIGGNIGQFSLTVKKMINPKLIDVIEPNPDIFKILSQNLSNIEGIQLYNAGIGPVGEKQLYFEEGRSGLGSVIKENVGNSEKVNKVNVQLVSDVTELTGRKHYDLIKIDVEGFEFELLKNIQKISCDYLFIEFSSGRRKLAGLHSGTLALIKEKFGDFTILDLTQANAQSESFEMLLEFKKRK